MNCIAGPRVRWNLQSVMPQKAVRGSSGFVKRGVWGSWKDTALSLGDWKSVPSSIGSLPVRLFAFPQRAEHLRLKFLR